jgi:hypothetical protein
MKWKRLVLIVIALELMTLALQFGMPGLQGRAFGDPKFPHLIVFHGDVPHSDIVDFRGNFYAAALESLTFWLLAVFGFALLTKLVRRLVPR